MVVLANVVVGYWIVGRCCVGRGRGRGGGRVSNWCKLLSLKSYTLFLLTLLIYHLFHI